MACRVRTRRATGGGFGILRNMIFETRHAILTSKYYYSEVRCSFTSTCKEEKERKRKGKRNRERKKRGGLTKKRGRGHRIVPLCLGKLCFVSPAGSEDELGAKAGSHERDDDS